MSTSLATNRLPRHLARAFTLLLLAPLLVALSSGGAASAAPAETVVQGWSTTAHSVVGGSVGRFPVRVTTGGKRRARHVRLQVRSGPNAAWSKPAWRRTSPRGRIVLRWRAPLRDTIRFVRVQVRKAPGRRGAVTKPRRLVVTTETSDPTPDFVAEVVRLTNEARSQSRTCGTTTFPAVGPVTAQSQLAEAAQRHADDMARHNYFSHTSLDGRSPWDRIRATGYSYSAAGENIAAGHATPREVVRGWIDSPGHCSNIMDADFTELGVGYAPSSTADFNTYWVQNFARPAGW